MVGSCRLTLSLLLRDHTVLLPKCRYCPFYIVYLVGILKDVSRICTNGGKSSTPIVPYSTLYGQIFS